ncbi:MAG: class I SAM-dependent methyltransferase [Clostridia bacterium]|nr:class I SAM-dependent methyltransferase [Clostridia bacterium]
MKIISENWEDFELIDCGGGMKLERWGDIILARPDPQAIWKVQSESAWKKASAVYHRSKSGGGSWEYLRKIPEKWTVSYRGLKFYVEPTGFKHTGLFPEQAANWDYCGSIISEAVNSGREAPKILNLFGYTGAATVACAAAGAGVCHVDAAKGMVTRARENVELSGLNRAEVRYIVDDAFKFVAREIRRGNKYDGIIMDPPSYGRGPGGEVWKLEDNIYAFVETCADLLSDKPLFFILNSYTTGFSPVVTENMLTVILKQRFGGSVTAGDLCLKTSEGGLLLPCGSTARWTAGS